MQTRAIAFAAPNLPTPATSEQPKPADTVETKPVPMPVPVPKRAPAPKPAPAPHPLPAPGAKAMSLRERLGTALYYGVQPPSYAYMAAVQAARTSVALAGIAALTPIVATEQGLEIGVSSAYKFLHDPKSPDSALERVAGIARHLVGDGVAGGVQSVTSAYKNGGQGLITMATSIPVSGTIAAVGFSTLGITVPLACLYGAAQNQVKTPSQFFDEVRRGQHRLPQ